MISIQDPMPVLTKDGFVRNFPYHILSSEPQIYIGADSQLNGATKNVSMGRMKSIQWGVFRSVFRAFTSWLCVKSPDNTLDASKSPLTLALHFCLFDVHLHESSPHFRVLSIRNVKPSTIIHSFFNMYM
jgi:hypothetical protein